LQPVLAALLSAAQLYYCQQQPGQHEHCIT
jgi:hypothetical protein